MGSSPAKGNTAAAIITLNPLPAIEANVAVLPTHLFGAFSGFLEGAEMFRRLYSSNAIPISSALLHFSRLGKECVFDEAPAIRGVEDYEMWLRLSSKGVNFFGLNEKLVGYRSHPGQMSRRVISMMTSTIALREKYRDVARRAGINVFHQDRVDHRDLANQSCNEKNYKVASSAILRLCDPRRIAWRGFITAARILLRILLQRVSRYAKLCGWRSITKR